MIWYDELYSLYSRIMIDKSSCKANIFHTFKGLVYSTDVVTMVLAKGCNQDTALQFTTMNLIYLNVLSFVISTIPEEIYCLSDPWGHNSVFL